MYASSFFYIVYNDRSIITTHIRPRLVTEFVSRGHAVVKDTSTHFNVSGGYAGGTGCTRENRDK